MSYGAASRFERNVRHAIAAKRRRQQRLAIWLLAMLIAALLAHAR